MRIERPRLIVTFPFRRTTAHAALLGLVLASLPAEAQSRQQLPPVPAPLSLETPTPVPPTATPVPPTAVPTAVPVRPAPTLAPAAVAAPPPSPRTQPAKPAAGAAGGAAAGAAAGSPAPKPAAAGAAPQTAAASAPGESPVRIQHDPLKCIVTEELPRVDAAVSPGPSLNKSYVFFRAANTKPSFYYVLMEGDAASLEAKLPRPLPDTQAIDYYLQAVDKVELRKKTPQYTPRVQPGRSCDRKGAPVPKNGANLTVGLTEENQDPVPPGFNKDDIGKIILASGAIVTMAVAIKLTSGSVAAASSGAGAGAGAGGGAGAAAGGGAGAAAAGGGVSTGLLIAGGAVLVGAGVAVAAGGGGGGDNATATPTFTPSQTATPTATPTATRTSTPTPTPTTPFHFIEADVTWSSFGNLQVQILNPAGSPVGQTVAHNGCGTAGNRVDRTIVQGTSLPSGTYSVRVSASSCSGEDFGGPITGAVSVFTEAGPRSGCSGQFFTVALNQSQTFSQCAVTVP